MPGVENYPGTAAYGYSLRDDNEVNMKSKKGGGRYLNTQIFIQKSRED